MSAEVIAIPKSLFSRPFAKKNATDADQRWLQCYRNQLGRVGQLYHLPRVVRF